MTASELNQLRALAQAATPGPWRVMSEIERLRNALEGCATALRDFAYHGRAVGWDDALRNADAAMKEGK